MTNDLKYIKHLRQKIDEAEAIVVGGASGMSAASGFRFYYMDDKVYKQIAGGLREKYQKFSMYDLLYDYRLDASERWAMLLRTIHYIYESPTGETYTDLARLLKGKSYYVATTNQDAQFFRVFPDNKITRIQGDWRYFQCSEPCHDAIYYNKEMVYNLIGHIEGDRLPERLIPRCAHCGKELAPWVRSREFLEGNFYQQEMERYTQFLRSNLKKKTLFLELGVGMMTPMFIKEPFMNMVYQWPDATYAVINPKDAYVPREIATKSVVVKDDILLAMKQLLGESVEGVRSDVSFVPARVY